MIETIECGPVVIGAGAIGLSIASALALKHSDVVILEAEPTHGMHTSSRNSEVIHSGIYYTPGSLKSTLCLSGKEKLYKFLEQHDIQYSRCGKIILAALGEESQLRSLEENARAISLPIEKLSSSDISKKLPIAKGSEAIFIPDTGFFDSDQFMGKLAKLFSDRHGMISYNSKVVDIAQRPNTFEISVDDGSSTFKIVTQTIVNSAGLFADQIARMAGFDKYKIFFYKGEYYKCSKIKNLPHLVYSVPPVDQLSLGIHTRSYLDGSVGFGPNAYSVDAVDYGIDDSRKREFLSDITKYLNVDISEDDIWPDYTGIRPKTNGGGLKSDFLIKNEECDGNKRMVNLIGMESPGLTCSLAIADMVSEMI
jgi:L-2-hydroxyglutarate oxidase LhgO